MTIQILGTGCPNCNRLETRTRQVIADLSIDASVEKITDIAQIMSFGVMSTPALAIDGRVVLAGRVPPGPELAQLLTTP